MSASASPLKKFASEWKDKEPKDKAFMCGGGGALLSALVGVFLPIVPQVPFAILAAFLFSRGSPALHKWVRKNEYFGKTGREWEDQRAVAPRVKIISSMMMLAGAGIGHWKLVLPWAVVLDVVFMASIISVFTRKTPKPRPQKK